MTQASPTIALNSQWLDSAQAFQVTDFTNTTCTNVANSSTLTYWPINSPGIWWYPYTGPSRPIRLGLSEIARLKAAAKRDAKLKAIFAKFTDLIEVAVDFE